MRGAGRIVCDSAASLFDKFFDVEPTESMDEAASRAASPRLAYCNVTSSREAAPGGCGVVRLAGAYFELAFGGRNVHHPWGFHTWLRMEMMLLCFVWNGVFLTYKALNSAIAFTHG